MTKDPKWTKDRSCLFVNGELNVGAIVIGYYDGEISTVGRIGAFHHDTLWIDNLNKKGDCSIASFAYLYLNENGIYIFGEENKKDLLVSVKKEADELLEKSSMNLETAQDIGIYGGMLRVRNIIQRTLEESTMNEVIIYCTPMKKYSKVGNFKYSLNGSAILYSLDEVRKEIAEARKNGFQIEIR